ncbi:MAPEG family protein [Ferrimonas balearica]|uniref:MAPEG family protein n=1 Tax=Ferrimonas balearica TaxID=44012 RepID=UPI001C99A976|nr:MAPEG family protein [Ferrimonas balearica]MBY5991120.1 MAPEG family protein [Ferrimonas balearica]
MTLAITGLYAALTGVLILTLAAVVVMTRRQERIGIGDGDHRALRLRIRVHANLIEYAPIALILLGCAEAGGAPHWVLHLGGALFLVGRLLHPWGLTAGRGGYHLGRFTGTSATWLAILLLAGVNIGQFLA